MYRYLNAADSRESHHASAFQDFEIIDARLNCFHKSIRFGTGIK